MRLRYFFLASLLKLFLFLLGPLVTGNDEILEHKDDGRVRVKRNLICALGLQGIIKDIFLSSLEEIQMHDPMDVGDVEDCKLRDGVFYGLSTLTNVTALDVRCEGDKIIFSTTLGMTNAKIKYKWYRKFLFRFSGHIWSKAKTIQFGVEVTWDMEKGVSFDVTNILVTKLDGFKFGFTGLGPINPVVSGFVNVLSKIWSNKITSQLTDLIRDALESQLNKVYLPF